jgi:hypothetical protein
MLLYEGKIIAENKSWVNASGVRHPPNWNAVWSDEDKKAMGMTEVADSERPSELFYQDISQNEDGSYNSTERSLSELKTQYIASTKRAARQWLESSDWQVIAETERERPMDEAVMTYRAAVISACTAIEEAITGAADMAAFKALFDEPQDADGNATGNAPMHDWPIAPE